MTFVQKAIGLFISPNEVFEGLPTNATRRDWLLPLLIYTAITALTIHFIVEKESLAVHFRELSEQEIRPQLDQFVQQGTVTQEQANWVYQFATPGTVHFLAAQLVGTFIGTLILVFSLGFILWQLGRSVMGGPVPYMLVVTIVSLTLLVASGERIITAVLMILTDSIFASPSLALLQLGSPPTFMFALLSRINLFTLWELWLVSLGLAWLHDRAIAKVFVLVSSLWLVWTLVTLAPVMA